MTFENCEDCKTHYAWRHPGTAKIPFKKKDIIVLAVGSPFGKIRVNGSMRKTAPAPRRGRKKMRGATEAARGRPGESWLCLGSDNVGKWCEMQLKALLGEL